MRSRSPARQTSFLLEQGWERVEWRARDKSPPLTMWRDPILTPGPVAGDMWRQILWPHEAEFRAERRLALVRSVMEG